MQSVSSHIVLAEFGSFLEVNNKFRIPAYAAVMTSLVCAGSAFTGEYGLGLTQSVDSCYLFDYLHLFYQHWCTAAWLSSFVITRTITFTA